MKCEKNLFFLSFFVHFYKEFLFLGIDVLSSGYDAATWTSKYKIFDFSEEGDTIHVPSINKTYTAPAMVNVVTDGMNSKRVEDSCLDVVTHFEGNIAKFKTFIQEEVSLIIDQ